MIIEDVNGGGRGWAVSQAPSPRGILTYSQGYWWKIDAGYIMLYDIEQAMTMMVLQHTGRLTNETMQPL